MSFTLTEDGTLLTETQESVTMPADYKFSTVNDYIHGVDRYFEELQWLALGMASYIDNIEKQRDALLDAAYTAIPFVEDHEGSEEYKRGVVLKAVKKIRSAIESTRGAA